jgi:hypothetical protein
MNCIENKTWSAAVRKSLIFLASLTSQRDETRQSWLLHGLDRLIDGLADLVATLLHGFQNRVGFIAYGYAVLVRYNSPSSCLPVPSWI